MGCTHCLLKACQCCKCFLPKSLKEQQMCCGGKHLLWQCLKLHSLLLQEQTFILTLNTVLAFIKMEMYYRSQHRALTQESHVLPDVLKLLPLHTGPGMLIRSLIKLIHVLISKYLRWDEHFFGPEINLSWTPVLLTYCLQKTRIWGTNAP